MITEWSPSDADGDPAVRVPPARSSAAGLALGAAAAVALLAIIVWVLTVDRGPTAWDTTLHEAGLDHRSAALTAVAMALSVTSEYIAYVIAPVATLLLLRPRPWWFGAVAGVLVLAAGQGLRVALAALIGRDRPPEADWEMHAAGFAMPSGHTATATFAAGLLCLGLACWTRSAWRYAAMAVLAVWVLVEGAGRVYLGMHWPTDVVAGWLLGVLFTVLAAALLPRLRARRAGRGAPAADDPSAPPDSREPAEQRSEA